MFGIGRENSNIISEGRRYCTRMQKMVFISQKCEEKSKILGSHRKITQVRSLGYDLKGREKMGVKFLLILDSNLGCQNLSNAWLT